MALATRVRAAVTTRAGDDSAAFKRDVGLLGLREIGREQAEIG